MRKVKLMKKLLHFAILLAALQCFICLGYDEYILYWQVEDTASINWFDGSQIGTVADYFDANGMGITSARAVSSAEPDGMSIFYMGSGPQNYVDEPVDNGGTAPIFSYILSEDPTQLSFAIELGNWENGEWTTLATTGMISYNDLVKLSAENGGMYILTPDQGYNLPTMMPWSPIAYAVPEPSSSMLVLMGCGVLALRRKSQK